MTFVQLIGFFGNLAQDLPYVGGLIRAYAAMVKEEQNQQERQREKQEFLNQIGVCIERSLGHAVRQQAEVLLNQIADEGRQALTSTNIQVQAQAAHRLEEAPQIFSRRFLYLASDNYASAARTADIAGQKGFLWRSYHADGANDPSIANVKQIRNGDLIVLAYRENGHFFILSPLIVEDHRLRNQTINDNDHPCGRRHMAPHRHAPFVLANARLAALLTQQDYRPDPVFERQCGLNVRALLSDVTTEATAHILQQRFQSPNPFQQTIWPADNHKVPHNVRTWIAGL